MTAVQRPPLLSPLAGIAVAYGVWRGLSVVLTAAAADAQQRLAVACAALLPGAGLLLAMIVVQMLARAATGALDPLVGRGTRFLQTNQRVIGNTVEQFAVFAPALLALAAGVRADKMGQVVALALVFALARLVFWIGYLAGVLLRAPGMAATLAVNIAALGSAAWVWLA
jgi:uncharacterized MAPEG superfamily protein